MLLSKIIVDKEINNDKFILLGWIIRILCHHNKIDECKKYVDILCEYLRGIKVIDKNIIKIYLYYHYY